MGFVGTLERERKVSLCRDERSDMGGYGLGFAVFLLFFVRGNAVRRYVIRFCRTVV